MNDREPTTSIHTTGHGLGFARPAAADQQRFPPQDAFAAGLRHHHLANTAYPIHHQTTMRDYRIARGGIEAAIEGAWRETDVLGLYVHVPFCAARCKYCEYTVVSSDEHAAEDAYFGALLREFDLYRERLDTTQKTLIGFDIGGGTPSFAKTDNIRRVVKAARASFRVAQGAGISIETTPAIADRDPDKIHAYREMGIERLSMGVQTTHLRLAQSLGREFEGTTMLERAVRNIRAARFRRFNIDLMYGFAGQKPATWRRTVEETIALGPEYITLYQMRYKGTQIAGQAACVTREAVNELRTIAHERLRQAGYAGMPGKNTYSRVQGDPGTSEYLTERVVKGTPYLGLGLGAQSLSPYTLSYNLGAAAKSLQPYLLAIEAGRLPVQDLYHLPLDVAMAKMISVSFYFGQIHREHFAAEFGVRLDEHFGPEVAFLQAHGLAQDAGPYLRLTAEGARQFNGVVALFYAGAVQDYLIHLNAPAAARDGGQLVRTREAA